MSERSELERLAVELAKEVANPIGNDFGAKMGALSSAILALASREEPKPCPFCGTAAKKHHYGGERYGYGCPNIECPAGPQIWAIPLDKWNRRALSPTTPEGWREVERCVVIEDGDAMLHDCCGLDWNLAARKRGESDADLLARLNPPPGTPVIRVRRAEG